MAAGYKAVQWNGAKIVYDLYVLGALAVFIGVFMAVGLAPHTRGHTADPVVLMIRALGSASYLMLTIALAIGPLARLSPRFLPMLYNRRHLGVITFIVAAAHAGLTLAWYHGGGPLNPFVSLFVSNAPAPGGPVAFPFEYFGVAALVILAVMAATSHDYWLNNLGAPMWKAIHMLAYLAYALLTLHIAHGALVTEKSAIYPALTLAALTGVSGLHILAGIREWGRDSGMKRASVDKGFIDVCAAGDIPENRAVIAPLPSGDRVAVFRVGASLYALDNACRHQNGPLGEGCVKDGLVTCPWHGWQYRPQDGVSPPPFKERVATYDLQLSPQGRVMVRTRKNPLGKPGARIDLGALA